MAKQLNPIYAIRDGFVVSINDICEEDKGLKCNCVCASCGDRLVAKIKGEKRVKHFAHYSTKDCEYGYESSLHLAAKDILSKAKKMVIPSVYVHFPDSYKKDELVSEAKEIEIEKVELEKKYGSIIPDIVVYAGGKFFFVEIYVTHRIDDEKLEKIRNEKISTIEVDLSKKNNTISVEELSDLLLKDSDLKKWKYNRLSEQWLNRFISVAEEMETASRNGPLHVDYCPINKRNWKGKPYANLIDDCLYCQYCIENRERLLCSGKARIATIADFYIPEEERIKSSNQNLNEKQDHLVAEGRCPYCGGFLVERESRFGKFLGCSNYPHCRFTA